MKEAAACFRESIGLREEFVHSFKGVRETPTYLVVVQGCRSTIVMSPIRINVAREVYPLRDHKGYRLHPCGVRF